MSEVKTKAVNFDNDNNVTAAENDSDTPLCKKFKKIKYEIDMQNYKINRLQRELQMKKEMKNFSVNHLNQIESDLKHEMSMLDEMISLAMSEQRNEEEENCFWGAISLNTDNDKVLLNPPQIPSDISKISGIEDIAYKLLKDNECIEQNRHRLDDCLYERDESICNLHCEIDTLKQQLEKLTVAKQKMAIQLKQSKDDKTGCVDKKLKTELQHYTNSANTLSCDIKRMEKYLQELRGDEFDCMKEKRKSLNSGEKVNALKSSQSQIQYSSLLNEHECLNDDKNLDPAEKKYLCQASENLMSEIEDYKILIKELQSQIELYRDKFMKAQEKVSKQKIQLKKLGGSKKEIEVQVNEEIQKIKQKFHEKIQTLCPYPQKYEESHNELEKNLLKIKELENELKETKKELMDAKRELKKCKSIPYDSSFEEHDQLKKNLDELQKKYCGMKSVKESLEQKLCNLKSELDELRENSAKIIEETKYCAEKNRKILHEQINFLEFDLVQCRAKSSLSLSEKEELIKQLKQELSELCDHFKNNQEKMKQLKDQVNHLSESRYNVSNNKIDCYQIFSNI